MAEGQEGIQLLPIDYQAAARLGGRWKWKKELQGKPSEKKHPFSNNPDPKKRVEAQSVGWLTEKREGRKGGLSPVFVETFSQLEAGKETCVRQRAKDRGERATEIHLRDLRVQEALVDPEHEIYSVLNRVGAKIKAAGERFRQREGSVEEKAGEEFSFHVTKRENVNAYTFRHGQAAFFETGIFVLLDQYLEENKGYGLAEDHIALLLTHEVSHSDDEAKQGFLNEEYCDVQGLILGAEAGYNPAAAVDVEDFLIWLGEGDEEGQGKKATEEGEVRNIYIPSHPDPHNRRLVLVDILHDETRLLPNRAKPFTPVKERVVEDLSSRMREWQKTCQKRVLPHSHQEVLEQIDTATNLSEVLDVLLGRHLRRKAELVKTLAEDREFTDKATLLQAVACELKARLEEGTSMSFYVKEEQYLSKDVGSVILSRDFKGYGASDLLVGGLAKSLPDAGSEEGVLGPVSRVKSEARAEMDQLGVKVYARPQEVGTSKEKRQLEERKAKMAGFILGEKTRKLFNLLGELDGKIDVARLLAGDFSENTALESSFRSLGIDDFSHYLTMLHDDFRPLTINEHTGAILEDRARQLYVDSKLLVAPSEQIDKKYVADLLEGTKYYRMAIFADREDGENDGSIAQLENDVKEKLAGKLREIADSLSSVPQERELVYKLLYGWVAGENLPYEIKEQIASSTAAIGGGSQAEAPEGFETPGLSEAITGLRIAPSYGGGVVGGLIHQGDRYNSRTGHGVAHSKASGLGRMFDFIRLYYHEGEYVESSKTFVWESPKYDFQLKSGDARRSINLIAKKAEMIPVFGSEVRTSFHPELSLLENSLNSEPPGVQFEHLKQVAQACQYESRYLSDIVVLKGVSVEDKTDYLMDSLRAGEFTLDDLLDVFSPVDVGRESTWAGEEERRQVGMSLLRRLSLSPLPGTKSHTVTFLCERLFILKLRSARYDKVMEKKKRLEEAGGETVVEAGYMDFKETVMETEYVNFREMVGMDLFEGLKGEEKLRAQLDFIFDFMTEGGTVALSRGGNSWNKQYSSSKLAYWGGMLNLGADANLLGIVDELGYPTDLIQEKVSALLEANKDRYSSGEVDKWVSLMAYCQQPELFQATSYKKRMARLRTEDSFVDRDLLNPDHVLQLIDGIMRLPSCSYRDECLDELSRWSSKLLDKNLDPSIRSHIEAKLLSCFSTGFSNRGLGVEERSKSADSLGFGSKLFIPASEKYRGDPLAGFYLDFLPAVSVWRGLVASDRFHSPLGAEYRKSDKFAQLDADAVERTVLYDRLRAIQSMPPCQLKEALTLFSLQTAHENLSGLKDPASFGAELEVLIQDFDKRFISSQAKQHLFKMGLAIELGGLGIPVTAAAVRERFPAQQEFLNYVSSVLPEKSAFRDTYIMLASEAYPLRVGDVHEFRELLFSVDYSTQNKGVAMQRAGLEMVRAMKSDERTKPKDIREFILWLVDEDRQVQSLDDFLVKFNRSSTGRFLLKGILEEEDILETSEKEFDLGERLQTALVKGASELLISLPLTVKRKLVARLFARAQASLDQGQLALLIKAGMPRAVHVFADRTRLAGGNNLTYNSLLDSTGVNNPTARTMFFNLVLGRKGLLEERIVADSGSFQERMGKEFDKSEMHQFIDEILQIFFRKAKFSRTARKTTQVVAHSLLEGLNPARRATVLHNLLSELPRIDFSQKDRVELQSRIFNIALSSLGMLGAKLGQTDEIVPEGWGAKASSLKHATKPMPFLTVADIFNHEGLSDDYVIAESCGAASTACGYLVENPKGEEQFVKAVRPEALLAWKGDFVAVEHMLRCLRAADLVDFETGPIIGQLRRLVEEELQTGKELDNVLVYLGAETEAERKERGGMGVVKMPLERTGQDREPVARADNSLLIFAEPLGEKQGYVELAKAKTDPELASQIDWERVNTVIVKDFLHRALQLGNWHTDPHEGNIMISRSGVIGREITGDNLIYIDFGQAGTVEGEEKRGNLARFLVGLGLHDRGEVAQAIYSGLKDRTGITPATIKKDLSLKPNELQDSALKALAKYDVEEHMTKFLKASINILPYLGELPRKAQFNLIAPYIPSDMRGKLRTKLIAKLME